MTTAMNGAPRANAAPRKSLAQQLDRMDQILDGLSDGLQAAVADAVRDAVGRAVQTALREVLGTPELVARLAPVPAATTPSPATESVPSPALARPSRASRLSAAVRSRAVRLQNRWHDLSCEAREWVRIAPRRAGRFIRFCWAVARGNVRTVLVAIGIGTAAGAACYFASPAVAAAVGGVATAILAGAVRLLAPFAALLATADADA